MASASSEFGSIDEQIERLKLQLVSEDAKGHSCQYCRVFKIEFRKSNSGDLDACLASFFYTTEHVVHRLGLLGCNFWSMISDRLAFFRLKEKARHIIEGTSESSYPSIDSSPYTEKLRLAAVLNNAERAYFLRHDEDSGVYWEDVSERNFGAKLSLSSSLRNLQQGNIIPNDLLRLAFHGGFMYFRLSVTLSLLKSPVNIQQLSSDSPTTQNWSSIMPSAAFLTLVPPINRFKIDRKHSCSIGSPMNLDPASSSTMDLIKCWLKKCEIQHGCGILALPSSMPSMILRVLSKDFAELVEVAPEMRQRYIALSYCWGQQTQSLLLTQSNRPSLTSRKGISISQLDPTIRDAMITTFELGFKYLWVDALCIIQDDEDFKARELEKMGDIYRNASFTVVPSAAGNVREGFLRRRVSTLERVVPAEGRPQIVFKMGAEWDDERSTDRTSIPVILVTEKNTTDRKEPWYNRAWTLQETIFSRRRLQYHERQTTWRCCCTEEHVLEDDGWISGGDIPYGYRQSEILRHVTTMLWNRETLPDPATVFKRWYYLVEQYSFRKLTYSADRLPAISSTAREFASILGDQYVCGLWTSDLASGLAWASGTTRLFYDNNSINGPSWSWASHTGGAFWDRGECRKCQDFAVVRFSRLPEDPFREAGPIEIHARGLIMPFSYDFQLHNDRSIEWSEDDSENPQITIQTDYGEDRRLGDLSQTKIHLLALIVTCNLKVKGAALVEDAQSPGRYLRVGLFTMRRIWPVADDYPEDHQIDDHCRWPEDVPEDYQDQLRIAFGGEKNVREIVLV